MCILQAHDGASAAEEAGRWEEERRVSRYADGLPLLETGMGRWGREVPADPALWACDETGVKENLWLNLSTGFIGSGRQARALAISCTASVSVVMLPSREASVSDQPCSERQLSLLTWRNGGCRLFHKLHGFQI